MGILISETKQKMQRKDRMRTFAVLSVLNQIICHGLTQGV